MDTLSIRTNPTSCNIQHNLKSSIDKLSKSMERLSSGLKLNSAKDDAANLSVSIKIDSQISGLSVANNNIAQGVSTLNSVSSSYDLITTQLQKIRDLSVQAASGTYSAEDCAAINAEAQQRIESVKNIIEKNNRIIGEHNFIDRVNTISMGDAIASGYDENHIISNAADFFSKINADLSGNFILMGDIDMSELGTFSDTIFQDYFYGALNGNGYSISNLKNTLFEYSEGATIENLGLKEVNISYSDDEAAALIRYSYDGTIINNCYVTGSITSTSDDAGGLIAQAYDTTVTNSYFKGNVSGDQNTGGLIGQCQNSTVSNCYSEADVIGSGYDTGGLVGYSWKSNFSQINTSGTVTSNGTESTTTGGLVGSFSAGSISDSYSTATVLTAGETSGGFAGEMGSSSVTNCYSTGNVTNTNYDDGEYTGGFIGDSYDNEINGAYSTGNVTVSSGAAGGFIAQHSDNGIQNAYSTGNVSGLGSDNIEELGGFIAKLYSGLVENVYATGNVYLTTEYENYASAGGFVGTNFSGEINNAYATGDVTGAYSVGGFAGKTYVETIETSYSTGSVSGLEEVGGFAGTVYGTIVSNSYSSGFVSGNIYTGGFAGRQYSEAIDDTNAWNITTSGQTTSAGDAQGVTSYTLPTITVQSDWENAGCKITPNLLTLQVGTTFEDTYEINNLSINIDLSGVDLSDGQKASQSIAIVDNALSTITAQNTTLSASINILESKIYINNTQTMTLTQSNSTIKDADFAAETAELVKQKILQETNVLLVHQNQQRMVANLMMLIENGA